MSVSSLVAPIKSAPGLHYRNPRFPLNINLPGNLECGNKIHIHGAVATEPNRFSLNLKNACQDANISLHFNPRFDEGCVVRNSRLDEAWGDEERDGENPFVPGQPFLLSLNPTADGYEVEVNGVLFTTFNHREGMPLCDVTHISMSGDVTVYGIHMPLSSFPIPLMLRVPKSVFLGDMVVLKGEVPAGSEKFHVNFQCGRGEDSDIMYHFNPRFGDNVLVCNSRIANEWGDEQNDSGLPCGPGDSLKLAIVAGPDGFVPFINGNQMSTFGHRMDVTTACTLQVDGDVRVTDVVVDCPPVRLPPHVPDVDIDSFSDKASQALHTYSEETILELKEPFGPGKAVYVSGTVQDDPYRFEINLQADSAGSAIALHVNPRFDEPDLVMNSLDGGEWGEEARAANPLKPGRHAEVHLLCTEAGFCVLVDGDEVAEFGHRVNAARVTHVSVRGSLVLDRVMVA